MARRIQPVFCLPLFRRHEGIAVLLITVAVGILFPVSRVNAELIERNVEYAVQKNDYGGLIAARFGMDWKHIAESNGLNPDAPLRAGQVLTIRFSRIVPATRDEGIIINIPDRTLYRFSGGRLKDYYFIAAGKTTWQTPLGKFRVEGKAKDPTWHVPVSIRREMESQGKEVVTKVPPGPENPLGKYWFQLSLSGIGLHGTNAPQSIFRFASHGCMRLRPEDAEYLFGDVPVGTMGEIVYSPVKMFRTAEGRVLVEVYKDYYRKGIDYKKQVERLLDQWNAVKTVDPQKLDAALSLKSGVVTDVTR